MTEIKQDLIDRLQEVGFTDYESRSIIALMQQSPATVYEIAKRARMPRPNAYAVLESLARKGAVQQVTERPARYAPLDPQLFLGRIAASTADRCRSLAQTLNEIERPKPVDHAWSISDSTEAHNRIEEMIDAAGDHVWIKASAAHLAAHEDALLRAAARGIDIVIILFGTQEDRDRLSMDGRARIYLHENSGAHVGASEHLFSLTCDFDSALTASIREAGYGIFTQNRPVVVLVESLIRHEIYMAEIFERFGREIEEVYGPEMLQLRQKYLPPEQGQALKERLSG